MSLKTAARIRARLIGPIAALEEVRTALSCLAQPAPYVRILVEIVTGQGETHAAAWQAPIQSTEDEALLTELCSILNCAQAQLQWSAEQGCWIRADAAGMPVREPPLCVQSLRELCERDYSLAAEMPELGGMCFWRLRMDCRQATGLEQDFGWVQSFASHSGALQARRAESVQPLQLLLHCGKLPEPTRALLAGCAQLLGLTLTEEAPAA